MPIAEGIAGSLIAALIYDGVKFGGQILLGKYWGAFRKAHKKALKKLEEEFPENDLIRLFGNYVNMELKLKFDKAQRNEVVENFKKGLKTDKKEFFIEKIIEEFKQYSKDYDKDLLESVVTKYVEEVEIQLLNNHELLSYEMYSDIQRILQAVERKTELLGDFLDNVTVQPIPEIPPQFVLPEAPYKELLSELESSNVFLIKGGAGIGKTILLANVAKELAEKGKPVFWYKITGAVDDFVGVLNRIAYFLSLHGERELFDFFLKERTDNITKMKWLIATIKAGEFFLFIDDVFKVKDEKLENFLDTLCRQLNEEGVTKVFYLSRYVPSFIDEGCLRPMSVMGLSESEARTLLGRFEIKLEQKQEDNLVKKIKGNPKYMEFFKAWYNENRPKEEIHKYIKDMPEDDEKLQTYLLNNVYNDVLTGDHKSLLQSIAIFRIPETKDFIEEIYNSKNGKNFNDILDQLIRRLLLVDFYKELKRYYAHDILIGFLLERIDNKNQMHLRAGKLYKKRAEEQKIALDFLESSYHFQEGADHRSSASMILKIASDCTHKGWFWDQILVLLGGFSSESIKDKSLYSKVLYWKGNLLCEMGQWDPAEQCWNECFIYESTPETKSMVFNSLGILYWRKGKWDKAIEFYDKGLKIKEKLSDEHGMAQTFNNLGLVYELKGEWDKAIEFYKKSLKIKEKIGDEHGMASTYNNLGLVYKAKGEWDKAIEFYNKALKRLEKIGDEHGMAYAFNNLGLVYQDKGEWDKAIEFYNKSIKIKEKIGDEHGMAQTFNNLGVVYCKKGDWGQAIEFYNNSLKIKEKIGDEHGMATTYMNLGNVYQLKEEWDKAIEFYNKSLKIKEKIGDEHGMAQTYGNMGNVYQLKGEWEKAIEFYNKTLKIDKKIGDEHGMAQTKANIGILYKKQGKKEEARKLLEESLKVLERIGDKPNAEIAREHLEDLDKEGSTD